MLLRCSVVFCLFVAAQSALIKKRNIPVEIVYDKSNPSHYGNRNLDEKIQISQDDLLKFKLSEEIINERNEDNVDDISNEADGNPYGIRNLDAKIQLSPEELGQALKHLPEVAENEENAKSAESGETENSVQEAKPGNLEILLQKAEEIVFSGVNSIRNNIDKASETVSGTKPSPEAWAQLNQTLETFFRDQYKRVSLKEDKPPENQNNNENNSQNNQNNEFMQNLINGFQSIANNFLGNNFNPKPDGPEDEQQQQQQQQNPFQTLVNMFTGGINQVVNNVNNLNGPNNSTGQEDSGTDGGSNFFGNVVHQIQQFFGGQGSTPSQSVNINQSDTGVQPPNNGQGGFIQGAINQFSQVVNNFRPSTSTSAPVQGDEGTLPSSTTQSSNFFQNIGQAVQNVNNVFRPQSSTTSPQGGGSNPITSGAQAIGGQFGQVIGGQSPAGGSGGSNPITSGAQAIGSQFGQLTGGQGGEGSGGSNPISSGAQAIGSQFGQLVGQGGAGGGEGSAGSNPITSGAQAIGSQFQQLVGGQKPSESGSGSSSTEKSKADNSQAKDSIPPEAEQAEKPKDEKKAPEVMETTE